MSLTNNHHYVCKWFEQSKQWKWMNVSRNLHSNDSSLLWNAPEEYVYYVCTYWLFKKSRIDLIRLVIYCRNLRSNLRRNYGVEFYLAKLLISSRNRGVECGSNPSSDSRWPTLIMLFYHLLSSFQKSIVYFYFIVNDYQSKMF